MKNFCKNTKKTNNSGTLQRAYNTRNAGNEQGENKKRHLHSPFRYEYRCRHKNIRRFEL